MDNMEKCEFCKSQLCDDRCDELTKEEVNEEVRDLMATINMVTAALEDLHFRLKSLKKDLK
jgi:hypothetical protein